MGTYGPEGQKRLLDEIDAKVKDALKSYIENMERIFSYGCRDEEYRLSFIERCEALLIADIDENDVNMKGFRDRIILAKERNRLTRWGSIILDGKTCDCTMTVRAVSFEDGLKQAIRALKHGVVLEKCPNCGNHTLVAIGGGVCAQCHNELRKLDSEEDVNLMMEFRGEHWDNWVLFCLEHDRKPCVE